MVSTAGTAFQRVTAKLVVRWCHLIQRGSALLLLLDITLAAFALILAHMLRFGPMSGPDQIAMLTFAVPAFVLICVAVFPACGLYTTNWRYPTFRDMLRIPRAVITASAIFVGFVFFVTRLEGFSRMALVIEVFVLVVALGGVRMIFGFIRFPSFRPVGLNRMQDGETASVVLKSRDPVLLVGSDSAADSFIRTIQDDPDNKFEPVGLLDNDRRRWGMTVRGIPVLGSLDNAEMVLEGMAQRSRMPTQIIFAEPLSNFADGDATALIELADRLGIEVSRLPRSTDLRDPRKDGRFDPCPVELSDLLGRPQAELDIALVERLVTGRRVLITGAGGSIGGELSRQVAALAPSELMLIDNCEYNLYDIDQRVRDAFPTVELNSIIGDVRDAVRIDKLFNCFRPELVFHAAALKHVPIVELNPGEGVLTNVVGSRNVARAARRVSARAIVQISTDKAVNTTNVMGATKRIAELYCQALDLACQAERGGGTRFMTVRFGNVLGSSGSLIPLLQRQIARGGPVTVTHPEMQRFFMTIREAVELTLQASAHGLETRTGQGEIFVLDMGAPIKIIDIARRMIRLAGLVPDKDISIEIVGIRPGEKLHEELFDANEQLAELQVAGAFRAIPNPLPLKKLTSDIAALERAARNQDVERMFALMRSLVAGYEPSPDSIKSTQTPELDALRQRTSWLTASLVAST